MTIDSAGPGFLAADELPLKGVRVLEFCHIAAGPFAAMTLADLGAEVIKIESPAGDGMRQWPPLTEGFSENFASLNRNKFSVSADLKNPAERDRVLDLIAGTDILLENNRPGVMNRLGLGPAQAMARNPALVYCSISAFGQSGPRATQGGFDVTIQAVSGIMSVTGEPDGAPVKAGVPMSDMASGLYATTACLAALMKARATGVGSVVDISMLASSLGVAALQTSEWFGSGKLPKALGSAHPRNAPYQGFESADRPFVMAAGNDNLWQKVCGVVDLPGLLEEPMFKTNSDRATNQVALKAQLEAVFVSQPAAHWVAAFSAEGVPAVLINNYQEALEDEQTQAMNLVQPLTLGNGQETLTVGPTIRLGNKALPIRRGPPALGQDNDLLTGPKK
ncbi:MAG: CoA transferase [Alphaproteobacteria bacterium]|nr:CoA transferase [Alphaproteobacteria bacterium]